MPMKTSFRFELICLAFYFLPVLYTSSALAENPVLELSNSKSDYTLTSLGSSQGFLVAEEGDSLKFFSLKQTDGMESVGLHADFKKHDRFWLKTELINKTPNHDWVLHVSNFGFQQVNVLVVSETSEQWLTFESSFATDINAIGRAINIQLDENERYSIIVELVADNPVWPPYVGLMTQKHYQYWKLQMDYAFKLGIGITLGMLLMGLVYWLVTQERAVFLGVFSSFLMLCYYLEHSSLPGVMWQYDYEKNNVFWLLFSSSLLSLLLFAGSFLQINRQSGVWFTVFSGVTVVSILVAIISIFLPLHAKALLLAVNHLLIWGVILTSGFYKVRTEGRYYVIYILGWLPLVFSFLHVIATFIFPQKSSTETAISYKIIQVLYVHILHMLIHAIALILKVKTLCEDKLKAEHLSQAKTRFMAQNSHDLRQPLSSMNIFLDYLKPHIAGEGGQAIFSQLKKTHKQMDESFNSIMDLSKLEACAIQAEIRPVALQTILERLQDEFEPLFVGEKLIRFSVQKTSLYALTDPLLLERILRNLISNALKYTHSGKVVVGCRRRSQFVSIQVSDTGEGIKKEDIDSIFDIYQRSQSQISSAKGSGIGLSIVKQLADLMGHPIAVFSIPGRGSTFTITLPIVRPSSKAGSSEKAETQLFDVAVFVKDFVLNEELTSCLENWSYPVKKYNSLETMRQTGIEPGLIICDETALQKLKGSFYEQDTVIACICSANRSLPPNWVALSAPTQPFQLRAILNFAHRYRMTL